MNYLVWPEGRKLYAVIHRKGKVLLLRKNKGFVPYEEEDREKYMLPVIFTGGDLYEAPASLPEQILIVYEQQGAKPSNLDAVIEVFGDARFDYQKFSDNAKYSKKQKPTPY